MKGRVRAGLFVAEGTSDLPLADIVEALFLERGVDIALHRPDFSRLGKVAKDLRSRLEAGRRLVREPLDLVVIHRDADNVGFAARRTEIEDNVDAVLPDCEVVPVIPIRMTEAWLLLDELAIRRVAGNPKGRMALALPNSRVEREADPKKLLKECLLTASGLTGRRRERFVKQFNEHRRQLLERLDPQGPVRDLPGWRQLLRDVDQAAVRLR